MNDPELLLELQALIHVDLPVPPMFEQTVRYPGDKRFVAFHSSQHPNPGGIVYTDGTVTGPGNFDAWQLWLTHPSTAVSLSAFGTDNLHWLLLDRNSRDFYRGGARQVRRFLQQVPGYMRCSASWIDARRGPPLRARASATASDASVGQLRAWLANQQQLGRR